MLGGRPARWNVSAQKVAPMITEHEKLIERLAGLEARCRRLAYPNDPPIFVEVADALHAALSQLDATIAERDKLAEKIEAAVTAFSETQPDEETRMHRMAGALTGLNDNI